MKKDAEICMLLLLIFLLVIIVLMLVSKLSLTTFYNIIKGDIWRIIGVMKSIDDGTGMKK